MGSWNDLCLVIVILVYVQLHIPCLWKGLDYKNGFIQDMDKYMYSKPLEGKIYSVVLVHLHVHVCDRIIHKHII